MFGTALVLSLRCRYRRAVATILRLLGFVVSLEQQRNRAARGIVDALLGVIGRADANDLGHDARDFRRGVKLDLALAASGIRRHRRGGHRHPPGCRLWFLDGFKLTKKG